MDLTSRAGRETAEKIRKEIEALKGDALLERGIAAMPEVPMREFPTSTDLLATQTTRRRGLC